MYEESGVIGKCSLNKKGTKWRDIQIVVQDRMCIQWMECSTEESEEVETANELRKGSARNRETILGADDQILAKTA